MPDYRFRCLGPFYFPTFKAEDGTRQIHHLNARDTVFWEADKAAKRIGLDNIWDPIGLYVMGLRPSGGGRSWPYYVGKAAGQPLYKRCFQKGDKPKVYNGILNYYRRARPFIYLFPLVRTDGRAVLIPRSKASQVHKVIDDAEYMLISMAMHVNPNLWNVQHRVALDRFAIDGTPKANLKETKDARAFREMMGFKAKTSLTAGSKAILEASEMAFQNEDEIQKELDQVDEAELEIEDFQNEPSAPGGKLAETLVEPQGE